MKKIIYISLLVIATILVVNYSKGFFLMNNKNQDNNKPSLAVRLADYPVTHGVSAPFTAVVGNRLVVAGGCNFPYKPPYEGGQKVFYKNIYTLDLSQDVTDAQWSDAGEMPYAVAYGSAVAIDGGMLCIGGQDDTGALAGVVMMRIDESTGRAVFEVLPSLPSAVFNGGAAIIGNKVYITGGAIADGEVNYIFELDMENISAGWNRISTNQRYERQQPVVFAAGGNLFLTGGYDENRPEAYTDIMKFDFESSQWVTFSSSEIKGVKRALVGTGVASINTDKVIFAGGVDYDRFMSALNRLKRLREATAANDTVLIAELKQAGLEYMTQPVEWYKFATSLVQFDASHNAISAIADCDEAARAGAGIALHNDYLYIVCGETKPGVRSEVVTAIKLNR